MCKVVADIGESFTLFEFKCDFCVVRKFEHVSDVDTMFLQYSRKRGDIFQIYGCKLPHLPDHYHIYRSLR